MVRVEIWLKLAEIRLNTVWLDVHSGKCTRYKRTIYHKPMQAYKDRWNQTM